MKILITPKAREDFQRLGLAPVTGWSLRKLYWRIPYNWRPGQLWYRFTCFAWHRHTTVRPRTLPFHTWADRDVLLVHCAFEILSRFVEEELDHDPVDWGADEHHRKAAARMRELYRWWKDEYPNSDVAWDVTRGKLHQLVEVCKFMWT